MACQMKTCISFDELLIMMGFKTDPEDEQLLTKQPVHEPEAIPSSQPLKEKGPRTKSKERFLVRARSKLRDKRSKASKLLRRRRSRSNKSNEVTTPATSVSSIEDLQNEDDRILEKRFPASTAVERKRFLFGRTVERATEKMEIYRAWRQQYQLDSKSFRNHPEFKNDREVWDFAVAHASKYFGNASNSTQVPSTLPQIVKFGETSDIRALDGRRIAQVLPGLIDKNHSPLEFYALCFAVYLDLKLDRNSDESVHVFVDVRAGKNWPNHPAVALVPFVKSLIKQLMENMPERMITTYVCPIPLVAKPIWMLIKGFLDKKIVKKITVMYGPASVNSALPKDMTNHIFNAKVIASLEHQRTSDFIH